MQLRVCHNPIVNNTFIWIRSNLFGSGSPYYATKIINCSPSDRK
jgi:hypothetical protein